MTDDTRLLRETSLFAGLDEATANDVVNRLVRKTFKRGMALFHQGDEGDSLHIVVDGSVQVVMTSESGERMVLTTLHPPDVLGEIALLDGGTRSATAEAVEETTTLVLSRGAFLDLMKERPVLVDHALRALGGLVRRLSEQAADFVFLDLGGRVAKVLLRLAEDNHADLDVVPVEVPVTQHRLAEMVGGSRQSVNQILHKLAQRDYIEVHGRRVLIYQPEQLRRLARIG